MIKKGDGPSSKTGEVLADIEVPKKRSLFGRFKSEHSKGKKGGGAKSKEGSGDKTDEVEDGQKIGGDEAGRDSIISKIDDVDDSVKPSVDVPKGDSYSSKLRPSVRPKPGPNPNPNPVSQRPPPRDSVDSIDLDGDTVSGEISNRPSSISSNFSTASSTQIPKGDVGGKSSASSTSSVASSSNNPKSKGLLNRLFKRRRNKNKGEGQGNLNEKVNEADLFAPPIESPTYSKQSFDQPSVVGSPSSTSRASLDQGAHHKLNRTDDRVASESIDRGSRRDRGEGSFAALDLAGTTGPRKLENHLVNHPAGDRAGGLGARSFDDLDLQEAKTKVGDGSPPNKREQSRDSSDEDLSDTSSEDSYDASSDASSLDGEARRVDDDFFDEEAEFEDIIGSGDDVDSLFGKKREEFRDDNNPTIAKRNKDESLTGEREKRAREFEDIDFRNKKDFDEKGILLERKDGEGLTDLRRERLKRIKDKTERKESFISGDLDFDLTKDGVKSTKTVNLGTSKKFSKDRIRERKHLGYSKEKDLSVEERQANRQKRKTAEAEEVELLQTSKKKVKVSRKQRDALDIVRSFFDQNKLKKAGEANSNKKINQNIIENFNELAKQIDDSKVLTLAEIGALNRKILTLGKTLVGENNLDIKAFKEFENNIEKKMLSFRVTAFKENTLASRSHKVKTEEDYRYSVEKRKKARGEIYESKYRLEQYNKMRDNLLENKKVSDDVVKIDDIESLRRVISKEVDLRAELKEKNRFWLKESYKSREIFLKRNSQLKSRTTAVELEGQLAVNLKELDDVVDEFKVDTSIPSKCKAGTPEFRKALREEIESRYFKTGRQALETKRKRNDFQAEVDDLEFKELKGRFEEAIHDKPVTKDTRALRENINALEKKLAKKKKKPETEETLKEEEAAKGRTLQEASAEYMDILEKLDNLRLKELRFQRALDILDVNEKLKRAISYRRKKIEKLDTREGKK